MELVDAADAGSSDELLPKFCTTSFDSYEEVCHNWWGGFHRLEPGRDLSPAERGQHD
ncbi:MAG: hypothetical protein ACXQT4_05740 [Methanotrichaceae archaeon]